MPKILKIIVIGFASIVAVAGLGFGILYAKSSARLEQKFTVQPAALELPTDAASIEHGKHLLNSLGGCTTCHGPDLGGILETEVPGLLTIRGPNITQGAGSVTKGYTTADWVRALRHGVARDGHALFMMPSGAFNNLTRNDLGAIIAAAQTFPPVDRTMEPSALGPLGHVLHALGQFPVLHAENINHTLPIPEPVSAAVSPDYGKYLVSSGGCVDCHRADLSGGRIIGTPPSIPPAANLTPVGAFSKWSDQEFIQMFRTGKRPDGSALHEIMPWKAIGRMTDDELRTVFLYLKTVPAKETVVE